MKAHQYTTTIEWTGNLGKGTAGYRLYSRDHSFEIEGKTSVLMSSDPAFRGDPTRMNPEELLVASLSSCHMLWYLHLCSEHNITVVSYRDMAEGIMEEDSTGGGAFKSVILKPQITILESDKDRLALDLHHEAHEKCFIANSMNFPVRVEAGIGIAPSNTPGGNQ